MTSQEKAEIISPAQQYLDEQAQYALDTFKAPSLKGVPGVNARRSNLLLCDFKPLEKLRADISANLELISNSLTVNKIKMLSENEIIEKQEGLSNGHKQIGFILSVELISKIVKDRIYSDLVEKRHIPTDHPVHKISKMHIFEHVKKISELTGDYHLSIDNLQYSNVPELNPHPSCLIGSIGRVALIHHVPERNDYGSSLFITPVELLQASA